MKVYLSGLKAKISQTLTKVIGFNAPLLPIFIIYALFLTLSLLHGGFFIGDEPEYHLPHLDMFLKDGFLFFLGKNYNTSNTPLTYIVVGLIALITKAPFVTARILTALFSFLSLLIAVKLSQKSETIENYDQESNESRIAIYSKYALVLFYPYFFLFSFLFYAMFLGVLTSLIAVYYITKPKKSKNLLLASIFLTLAILSQQFYLVLIPIFLIQIFSNDEAFAQNITINRKRILTALLFLIPFAIPLALFIYWGGLRTPNFNQHHIAFVPSNLTAILFVLGFTFLPIAIKNILALDLKPKAILLLVSILLVLFNAPEYSNSYNSNQFAGFTHRIIYLFNTLTPIAYKLAMFFFVLLGFGFTTSLVKLSIRKKEYFYLSIVLHFAILLHFFQPSAQRHTIPLILFTTVLFIRVSTLKKEKLAVAWLIIQSLTYFIYTFTVKGLSS